MLRVPSRFLPGSKHRPQCLVPRVSIRKRTATCRIVVLLWHSGLEKSRWLRSKNSILEWHQQPCIFPPAFLEEYLFPAPKMRTVEKYRSKVTVQLKIFWTSQQTSLISLRRCTTVFAFTKEIVPTCSKVYKGMPRFIWRWTNNKINYAPRNNNHWSWCRKLTWMYAWVSSTVTNNLHYFTVTFIM